MWHSFPGPGKGQDCFQLRLWVLRTETAPLPRPRLLCAPQYSHQSGQFTFPLTRPSGAVLHLFD